MKPTKAKPAFYAVCYQTLKEISKEHGYNMVIHGSLNRDMDLICIPWVDDPKPELDLILAIDKYINDKVYQNPKPETYMWSMLPGGRSSYVININRGGIWNQNNDEQWYLDISFTPLKLNSHTENQ